MRKLIKAISLSLLLGAAQPAAAALKIFACEPEWAALATALGGNDVEVYAATSALQDVHKVQARPSLIAKYRQAALVVCTGAELEVGWYPPLMEKGNNPAVLPGTSGYFEASKLVAMLDVPATLDRSQGDVHPSGNPHIQTAPDNIALVAPALAERLAQVDPAHAKDYRARYQDFRTRWEQALLRWRDKAAPLKGVSVVSGHKSWTYLYRWLGMREVATLEAKPGIPPSGAHLESVLAQLQRDPAAMVVFAAYQDRRPADWLAMRAQIPVVELPFSTGGAPGTDDLFGLFDVTIERLLAALHAKKE